MRPHGARVVLTGCSGGGKSTLAEELARRGVRTFPEPGREVVRAALAGAGGVLPDEDPLGFALACLAVSHRHVAECADASGPSLFDRSPIDVLSFLQHRGLPVPVALLRTIEGASFHPLVVFAPPWPEIFVQDAERRHGFERAAAEYARLHASYAGLGFTTLELPRSPVAARAGWLLDTHPAFKA